MLRQQLVLVQLNDINQDVLPYIPLPRFTITTMKYITDMDKLLLFLDLSKHLAKISTKVVAYQPTALCWAGLLAIWPEPQVLLLWFWP